MRSKSLLSAVKKLSLPEQVANKLRQAILNSSIKRRRGSQERNNRRDSRPLLTHEVFDYLNAPIERIGNENTPIPFSPPLEGYVRPDQEKIYRAVKKTLQGI